MIQGGIEGPSPLFLPPLISLCGCSQVDSSIPSLPVEKRETGQSGKEFGKFKYFMLLHSVVGGGGELQEGEGENSNQAKFPHPPSALQLITNFQASKLAFASLTRRKKKLFFGCIQVLCGFLEIKSRLQTNKCISEVGRGEMLKRTASRYFWIIWIRKIWP